MSVPIFSFTRKSLERVSIIFVLLNFATKKAHAYACAKKIIHATTERIRFVSAEACIVSNVCYFLVFHTEYYFASGHKVFYFYLTLRKKSKGNFNKNQTKQATRDAEKIKFRDAADNHFLPAAIRHFFKRFFAHNKAPFRQKKEQSPGISR